MICYRCCCCFYHWHCPLSVGFCCCFYHWHCYLSQVLLLFLSLALLSVTGSAVVFIIDTYLSQVLLLFLSLILICHRFYFCCFCHWHCYLSQVLLFASAHTQCWHIAQSDHLRQKKWWNGCKTKNGVSWFLMVRSIFPVLLLQLLVQHLCYIYWNKSLLW